MSDLLPSRKLGAYFLAASIAMPVGCASYQKKDYVSRSPFENLEQAKAVERAKIEKEFEILKKTLENYKEKDSEEYKALEKRLEEYNRPKGQDITDLFRKREGRGLMDTIKRHPYKSAVIGSLIGTGLGFLIHSLTKGDARDFVAPEPEPPKPPDPGPPPKRRGG